MIQRRVLAGSAVTALLVLAPAVAANAATTPTPTPTVSPSPKPTTSASPTASPTTSASPKPSATATKAPTGAPKTGFGDSSNGRDVAVATAGVLALAAGAAVAGVTLTRRRGQY